MKDPTTERALYDAMERDNTVEGTLKRTLDHAATLEAAAAAAMVACPDCGQKMPQGTAKCPNCGHDMADAGKPAAGK